MKKIIVLGLTASGKTTLANRLGKVLDIPVYHLDKTFWREKGGIKQDVFLSEQEEMMKSDKWILDGTFPKSKSLEVRIRNADTIILFDLPFLVVLWHQMKRFLRNTNEHARPLTWKELKYAVTYPIEDIYSKIMPYKEIKTIIVIKNYKDQQSFWKNISTQF
jgi:adenylate kinase family enzyme